MALNAAHKLKKAHRYIMGLFTDEDQAAAAVQAMETSAYTLHRVHSPLPSEKLARARKKKKSMVGWFTLTGGIIGFFSGFALAAFTATRWDLVVGGKPIVALIPFFIVGFEFTILFAVFGNVIGLLTQTNLPSLKNLEYYDPRCSGFHYGLLASCEPGQEDGLKQFFTQKGAEITVFEEKG